MPAKYEVDVNRSGKFYFVLKAPNGEIVLTSRKYTSRYAAEMGVVSARRNTQMEGRFRLKGRGRKLYFAVYTQRGTELARSECYTSNSSRERGIKAVVKHAGTSQVDVKN